MSNRKKIALKCGLKSHKMLSRGPFHKEVRRILSITLSLSSSVISNSTPRRVNRMQDVTIFKLGQQAYFKFLNVDLGKSLSENLGKFCGRGPKNLGMLQKHLISVTRATVTAKYRWEGDTNQIFFKLLQLLFVSRLS